MHITNRLAQQKYYKMEKTTRFKTMRFDNKQVEVLSRCISIKQCETIATQHGYGVNTLYNVLRGNSDCKYNARTKKAMVKSAVDFAIKQAQADLDILKKI